MLFSQVPTIFLSFAEENADDNFDHLKTLCPDAQRVHGVKGFDAAHRTASAQARQMNPSCHHFITVDGDNTTLPDFWYLDTDNIPLDMTKNERYVLSWNAYNPLTGLCYGNGGIKLWSHAFIDNMVTHEQTGGKVVDFCWDPCYYQLARIYSVTRPYSTPRQAFVAGFREGAKMTLVDGKPLDSIYETAGRAYALNLQRLITWCSVGNHIPDTGSWSVTGALCGFWSVHVAKTFSLKDISDLTRLSDVYAQYTERPTTVPNSSDMRREIMAKTGIDIPQFGAKQSKFIVERTRPVNNHSPFERETWPQRFEAK